MIWLNHGVLIDAMELPEKEKKKEEENREKSLEKRRNEKMVREYK